MSKSTRQQVLARQWHHHAQTGQKPKPKILDEMVELFGAYRQAAILPLRPRTYNPGQWLPRNAVCLAALQPCGARLMACLPDETHDDNKQHLHRLDPDVREALLRACRAALTRRSTTSCRRSTRKGTNRRSRTVHHHGLTRSPLEPAPA